MIIVACMGAFREPTEYNYRREGAFREPIVYDYRRGGSFREPIVYNYCIIVACMGAFRGKFCLQGQHHMNLHLLTTWTETSIVIRCVTYHIRLIKKR